MARRLWDDKPEKAKEEVLAVHDLVVNQQQSARRLVTEARPLEQDKTYYGNKASRF
jgi:signal transduction histidine kinase